MYNLIEEVLVQICKGQVNASLIRAICRQVKRFIKIFITLIKKTIYNYEKKYYNNIKKREGNPQKPEGDNNMKKINKKNYFEILDEMSEKLAVLNEVKKCYLLYDIYEYLNDTRLGYWGVHKTEGTNMYSYRNAFDISWAIDEDEASDYIFEAFSEELEYLKAIDLERIFDDVGLEDLAKFYDYLNNIKL